MFLNTERSNVTAFSTNSEAKKSSHEELEYYSDLDSDSEEGSTTSEEDTFLSIRYPSPPYFPKPYLHNQDFRSPDKALKYIMKHFNLETIHKSVKQFPYLSHDFIYSNTFVDPDHFILLQHYINKSIRECNAYLQKWLELHSRYIASEEINPLIVTCIL